MKRLIKLVISILVRIVDIMRAILIRLVGRKPSPTCVVIYYHGVTDKQRKSFARQIDMLCRLTTPIRGECETELEKGLRYSVVTFDDGFVSVLENAQPKLIDRNVPWTLFVPSGCLGQRPAWIRDPSHPAYDEVVLNRVQLSELGKDDLVTIGSHSVSHPNFLRLKEEEVDAELRESKETLEGLLGDEVNTFSFPHGNYNDGILRAAKEIGYRRVFTIDPGLALTHRKEFSTSRVAVHPDESLLEFKLKVLGAYRWIGLLKRVRATT